RIRADSTQRLLELYDRSRGQLLDVDLKGPPDRGLHAKQTLAVARNSERSCVRSLGSRFERARIPCRQGCVDPQHPDMASRRQISGRSGAQNQGEGRCREQNGRSLCRSPWTTMYVSTERVPASVHVLLLS